MPGSAAAINGQAGTGSNTSINAAPLATGTGSRKGRAGEIGTRSKSLLPTDEDEKKSLTLGRYQFRKDGAGWECKETIGKGKNRKRVYLKHLSRTNYEKMQARAATKEELERKLIEWADRQKEEKGLI